MSDIAPRTLMFLFSIGLTVLLIFGGLRLLQYVFRDTAFARGTAISKLVGLIRTPLRIVVAITGINIVLFAFDARQGWVGYSQHAVKIALIVSLVWLACAITVAMEEELIERYGTLMHPEEARVRRSITQISLLRRIVIVAIIFFGALAILSTFDSFRAVGAGLLASAGIISIVVGIAAQSTLGNVFAGIQLAFSDMLRVGDVVVIDDESGTVDDITLTTVIVHLWNDRRLILPSSHFVENGFENWTRTNQRISGDVELDLDWTAPLDAMRVELAHFLASSPLWDGRTGSMVVSQATGGMIRVRIDLSAADTLKLFSLRNAVREGMVNYVVEHAPHGVPRGRTELTRE